MRTTITFPGKVMRRGDSYCIPLNRAYARMLGVTIGSDVDVTVRVEEGMKIIKVSEPGETMYGIFYPDGLLDANPEPLVWPTRREALEFLDSCEEYEGIEGMYVDAVSGSVRCRTESR